MPAHFRGKPNEAAAAILYGDEIGFTPTQALQNLYVINGKPALYARAMADEIGVMYEGRIQQWDTPYNLYHRPGNRFVADFVGKGVFVPGSVLADGQVEIELGVLRSGVPTECGRGCGACGKGCGVDVLLRPDDVIHDDASPTRAEVRNKAFRGADIMYTLRLASGTEVLSLVPSHHNHAIGEHIGVRLEADHVIAFRQQNPA